MSRWIAIRTQARQVRVWVMDAQKLMARHVVARGGLSLTGVMDAIRPEIEPYMQAGAAMPVICAGAGDTPSILTPAAPQPPQAMPPHDPRLALFVLPGLKQARPADVIRSGIVQIAGFIAAHEGWDGVLCLPETRSLWVHISAGEVVSFRSFMTPEISDLLITRSSLAPLLQAKDWNADAFTEALNDAMSRPENLAAALSMLQTQQPDSATTRARVSGLLIGMELAAARAYWLGQNVAIVGAGPQAAQYRAALTGQGVPTVITDSEEMSLRGFIRAYEELKQ